ncbi:MAG: 4Fe-4S binding protein [Verrucomicrobiae bacterium]|nr:4Fe-4S binding protein [Verrucomicrobiae bacterium]
MNIIKKTYNGLWSLLSGMALTFSYFIRFDKVITQQYPENRNELKLPERSSARIDLIYDEEKGDYRCTACTICVRACPNGSIEVHRKKDPQTNKVVLDKFVYHLERCLVCGLCVDACPFDALKMDSRFENAVYDKSQLTLILNSLPKRPPKTAETPQAEHAEKTQTQPAEVKITGNSEEKSQTVSTMASTVVNTATRLDK